MVVAFLGCYPLLLTQQIRRQKVYIFSASLLFASIGFISGYFIQLEQSLTTIVFRIFALLLLCLVLMQIILVIYRSSTVAERLPQFHTIMTKCFHSLPKWVDLVLGWSVLVTALSYLILGALVFTESCSREDQQAQCLMPVAMGAGFLFYGTLILLHLLAILKLPRPSTPEYYEGITLTFWGLCSLLLFDTPILGTEWRAINLGLLWFTGGVFSLCLSLQTWIPALREKNIINALIVCLTGRAIVRGLTQVDDPYAAEVHTMLGYVLIVGAICRLTQIVFRKSPADSLPHPMFQQNTDTTQLLAEDEDEDELDKHKQQKKCKHRFMFASVTLVMGILASLLSVCSGILLMGANVGWIRYMRFYIQDPITYINISLAAAFLWSAYVFGLCTVYKNLKTRNAIHQYEYMQLENPNSINTMTITNATSASSLYPHDESDSSRQWIHVNTHHPQHAIVAMPTPSPTVSEQLSVSSPTEAIPHELSIQTKQSETKPSETIRPSEYRAKRRSLLVQSPVAQVSSPMTRARSSSMYGVGGVLPDEFVIRTDARRSWRSSASSTLGSASIESMPDSLSSDEQFKVFSNISHEGK
ncbi:Protein YTP1 [Choanephora cucurbitarum]|uniref:Protein YTP1 n=1 Tax=Choanephora cucurbitarum TaxID=101091 RepID=A0A1C7N4B1_9FUNG|nr:Protein YTP1 [Choanephora cucurbitarum]